MTPRALEGIDASGPLTADERSVVGEFLGSVPLPGDDWGRFKRFVRQLEGGGNDALYAISLRRLDEQEFESCPRPFRPTLGYWKRRGRRVLRRLARAAESRSRHDAIVRHLIGHAFEGRDRLPSHAWILFDLLFGKPRDESGRGTARRRIAQDRHGRGPVRVVSRVPSRRTVLEDRLTGPDEHLVEWLAGLVAEARRPWEVLEMAVRRLRFMGQPMSFTPAFVARAAASGSLLLKYAVCEELLGGGPAHAAEKRFTGPGIDAASLFDLLLSVGAGTRRRLMLWAEGSGGLEVPPIPAACLDRLMAELTSDRPAKAVSLLIDLLQGPLRHRLPDDLSKHARDFFAADLARLLSVPGATPERLTRIRRRAGTASRSAIERTVASAPDLVPPALAGTLRARLFAGGPTLDEIRGQAVHAGRLRSYSAAEQTAILHAAREASESLESDAGGDPRAIDEQAIAKRLSCCQGNAHLQVAGIDLRVRGRQDASYLRVLSLYNASLRAGISPHYAEALLNEAFAIDPFHGWVPNNLGWLLATTDAADVRNPARAVELAATACEASGWRLGTHWDTLAAACAAAGRFPEAIVAAEAASRLDADLAGETGKTVLAALREGRPHPGDRLGGEVIAEPEPAPDDLIPARRGSKAGYVFARDPAVFVIPPRFDQATPFVAGQARVRVGANWGIIDLSGNLLVDPAFASIGPLLSGLAVATRGNDQLLVGRAGRVLASVARPVWLGFCQGGSGADPDCLVESGVLERDPFAAVVRPPPASGIGLAAMATCSSAAMADWLDAVALSPEGTRRRALEILVERVGEMEFSEEEVLRLVSHDWAWPRGAGWRLVRASATDSTVLETVWQRLADRGCVWQLESSEAMATVEDSADVAEVAAGMLAADPPAMLEALGGPASPRRSLARIAVHRMKNRDFARLLALAARGGGDAGVGGSPVQSPTPNEPKQPTAASVPATTLLPADVPSARVLDAIEASLREKPLCWNRLKPWVDGKAPEPLRARGWSLAAVAERDPALARSAAAAVTTWKPGPAWQAILDDCTAVRLLIEGGLTRIAPDRVAGLAAAWKEPSRVVRLDLQTLLLLAVIDDACWISFRPELLRRSGLGDESFWRGCLEGPASAAIAPRLASEPEIVESFAKIAAEWPASCTASPAAPLLRAWIERNGARVANDRGVLVSLAAHVDPVVRGAALAMLERVSIDPVTLARLVETGHPDCESLASRLLDSTDPETLEETIVLLWDSPKESGRRVALAFVAAGRPPMTSQLLQRLSETRDPRLLAGLGSFIESLDPAADLRRRYEAIVLRAPWFGRPAKEAVKRAAVAATGGGRIETATLQALADAPAAIDREWALTRLVDAARRGESVDGLTILGESSS